MKRQNTNIIIILILVALIAVSGAVLAVTTLRDRSEQASHAAEVQSEEQTQISNEELDALLEAQPMFTDGVKYYYATSSKQLEHDAMGATVFNNSDINIESFTIAFCAYDENGQPIKIRQPNEKGEGAYIRTISYDLASAQGDRKYIEPRESFDNVIFYVENEPQIVTIKACVKEYRSTQGISWKNPYYKSFKTNYSGKELNT